MNGRKPRRRSPVIRKVASGAHYLAVFGPARGTLCGQELSAMPAGSITVRVEQVNCSACLMRLNALLADIRNRQIYDGWLAARASQQGRRR